MHRNLSQPTHRDVIERPLPFEAGEGPLYGPTMKVKLK